MEFTTEQLEYLKTDEGRGILETNGVVTKIADLDTILADESGIETLFKNDVVKRELDRRNSKSYENFRSKELEKYVPKEDLLRVETEYQAKLKEIELDSRVEKALTGAKYPELLMSKVDKTKLATEEEFKSEIERVRTTYSDLFVTKVPTTPVPKVLGGAEGITYEQFQNMTQAERRKIPLEELNKLLR